MAVPQSVPRLRQPTARRGKGRCLRLRALLLELRAQRRKRFVRLRLHAAASIRPQRCAAHANMRRGALPWYSRLVLRRKPTGADRRCRAAWRDGNGTGAAASIYVHTCARCASLSARSFGAAAALQRQQCLGDRSSGAHCAPPWATAAAKSAGGDPQGYSQGGTRRCCRLVLRPLTLPRNAELAGWVRERREERTC
jgi:hypothetical protein